MLQHSEAVQLSIPRSRLRRWLASGCIAALAGCSALGTGPAGFHTAKSPSAEERYCAWYGSRFGDELYFGQAAFWSSMKDQRGDPQADLRAKGPVLIGRFDLKREKFLRPIAFPTPQLSGVWDVLAGAGRRVYFTTFFETAGIAEFRGDGFRIRRFDQAGVGLNELAPGRHGTLLASRYGSPTQPGSVVWLSAEGVVLDEYPLRASDRHQVAPKTVAWDPLREEIWVTTDLLPIGVGETQHDARVLDANGREIDRITAPEVQFVIFDANGTGYWAERAGSVLMLRVRRPGTHGQGNRILLTEEFGPADFVQDLTLDDRGRVVVTRWSGEIHVVDKAGEVRTASLPRPDGQGLYYTAVLSGDRVCATYCSEVSVVCRDLPKAEGPR